MKDDAIRRSPFGRVLQVGILVPDVGKAVEQMYRVFGVKPGVTGHIHPGNLMYRGKKAEFDALLALFDLENMQLEFLQPLSGETIWREHVDEHGYGIHHICFECADDKQGVEYMNKFGMPVTQSGDSRTPGKRWACFDTEETLGFVMEMMSKRPDV